MHFLGLDGGGTGCRAAISTQDGRIIGRGAGGPANINTNPEQAAENILSATQQALGDSGLRPESLIAVLGLAGGAIGAARGRLAGMLPFAHAVIVNDAVTATRGALGMRDGILAAFGTGSVFAIQRGGQIRQFGGRGFLMGDEGSGAVLGRSLLAQAMRAADGFVPMTPLLAEILAEFGGPEGIIGFGNRAAPANFATLAPRLTGSDDPAARHLLDQAVAQIVHILTVLQGDKTLPVTFQGGLGPFYAQRLAGRWPVMEALGDAVDGALAMARDAGQLR